jgi:hypothetical protein
MRRVKPRLSMVVRASAEAAFRAFLQVTRVPEWLPIVRRVQVLACDADERPERVAFRSQVGGQEVGFELCYRYDSVRRRVEWSAPAQSERQFAGSAEFEPLAAGTCLFHYEIEEAQSAAVPNPATLPVWTDEAWVAMKAFGEWLARG